MYPIKYLPDTIIDKEDIKEYLSQYYPDSAGRFFSRMRKRIAHIKKYPYSCPVYEGDPDYRRLVVDDFLVFYMVRENPKSIEIHRIFHGSQDISRQLNV